MDKAKKLSRLCELGPIISDQLEIIFALPTLRGRQYPVSWRPLHYTRIRSGRLSSTSGWGGLVHRFWFVVPQFERLSVFHTLAQHAKKTVRVIHNFFWFYFVANNQECSENDKIIKCTRNVCSKVKVKEENNSTKVKIFQKTTDCNTDLCPYPWRE